MSQSMSILVHRDGTRLYVPRWYACRWCDEHPGCRVLEVDLYDVALDGQLLLFAAGEEARDGG